MAPAIQVAKNYMIATVFVDTNIFVYARDLAFPRKQSVARGWLERLWRDRTGRVSVQVLSEYYTTMTRKLRPQLLPEDAWEDVRALAAWRPQPVDLPVLERGREIERRFSLSWWDSLIVAAAQMQDCTLLLSEDLQDAMTIGNVTIRNPFARQATEPIEPYAAASASAERHPARGRPRKRAR